MLHYSLYDKIVFPSKIDGHIISKINIKESSIRLLDKKFKKYDVVIENGIRLLNKGIFNGSAIRSIVIPPSLTIIPAFCFSSSTLEEIIFQGESSVKGIGDSAFEDCPCLKSITLPKSVTVIGSFAFRNSRIENITFPNVPELRIEEWAFNNCLYLRNITFPQSILFLGRDIFNDCKNLTSVDMSLTDVLTIPNGMFEDCHLLNEVKLPRTVKFIGIQSFRSCYNLKTVNIADTQVEEIGNGAFDHCSKYEDGNFPNTLEIIGISAFADCNIDKLSLPPSLTQLEYGAFQDNPLSEGIDLLPLAFCNLIGDYVFSGCGIESVTIPSFVGEFVTGRYMFSECNCLKEVWFMDGAEVYDGMFAGCLLLNDVVLPNTLENIPDYVFYKTISLKHIKFPDSLKTVGFKTFSHSSINEVDLSNTTSITIRTEAFNDTNLSSVKLPVYGCEIHIAAFKEHMMDMIKESIPFATIIE